MKTPFDGRFKILAEEYPDLLLRLLGIVGPETKSQTIDVLRELQLDPVQVDHVYRIGGEDPPRLVHFEAITSWKTQRIPLLALYHFLLAHKFGLPVSSYVVLMAQKYVSKALPERIVYEAPDGLRIETPYQLIRLWEIDPSIAFAPGCEALLPWVPLLKGGVAEFEQAIAAIERLCNHPEDAPYPVEVMVNNLATLATLRYDKDTIGHFLKRLEAKTMLSTDLFTETWLYKDGVAAGEAKGEARGLLNGKRAAIRMMLGKKFPSLGTLPELDQISRLEALDELFQVVFDAASVEDVQTGIQAALQVN